MAGKIKQMIDIIIEERSRKSPALVGLTRAKMTMKGIYPDKFTNTSEDDPVIVEKLMNIANDLNIKL